MKSSLDSKSRRRLRRRQMLLTSIAKKDSRTDGLEGQVENIFIEVIDVEQRIDFGNQIKFPEIATLRK